MNVFISWSGKDSRSHKTALLLRDWLPKVIQKVTCFVSSNDIDAGAQWANELFKQLDQCNIGILCLSPESLTKPWLLFEAGALAKHVENSRVCPILIDLQPSDVGYPLAAFQFKTIDKEGIKGVIEMVNASRGGERLSETELEEAFDFRWPQFEEKYLKLPAQENRHESRPQTKEQKTLAELLELVRGLASGRIPVKASQIGGEVFDPSDYAFPPDPIIETLDNLSKEPVTPDNQRSLLNYLYQGVRKQRPLISGWIKYCSRISINDKRMIFHFGREHRMFAESLLKPNNKKLLLAILQERFQVSDIGFATDD